MRALQPLDLALDRDDHRIGHFHQFQIDAEVVVEQDAAVAIPFQTVQHRHVAGNRRERHQFLARIGIDDRFHVGAQAVANPCRSRPSRA